MLRALIEARSRGTRRSKWSKPRLPTSVGVDRLLNDGNGLSQVLITDPTAARSALVSRKERADQVD
jgi:hypothetical protein